jgi:protein gp37
MGETSKIEWTDATVNFWWGCTKVGPGCDHCYAEAFDKRVGGSHWGLGAPRRKIASAVALIHRLDNQYAAWAADATCAVGNAKAFGLPVPNIGTTRRVFIQSMSDLFDLEVPLEWFAEAWQHITACDRLDIQIVTKRISAVEKRLAAIGVTAWPRHAGLIVTVVNQEEADRDVPRLLVLKAKFNIPWVGLSIEPMLGRIALHALNLGTDKPSDALRGVQCVPDDSPDGFHNETGPKIDWVIVGGESGAGARPTHPEWIRSIRDWCKAAGTPFLFKQWGSWKDGSDFAADAKCVLTDGRVVDPTPDAMYAADRDAAVMKLHPTMMRRVSKKIAGRLLDGIEHNGFPALTVRGI